MLRISLFVTALAVMLTAPPVRALEFSVLGPTTVTVAPGEPFTIDVALDNVLGEAVQGVSGTIIGLASAGAVVNSGRSAFYYLAQACLPAPTGCIGGIDWPDAAGDFWLDLTILYQPGDDDIVIFEATGLSPSSADGSLDPGVDETFDGLYGRDSTLELAALTVGVHVLTIGGFFSDGSATLPVENGTTFTVRVIPEPTTSLLLALGLMGISLRRGRGRVVAGGAGGGAARQEAWR